MTNEEGIEAEHQTNNVAIPITADRLATLFEQHMQVTAFGILVSHPNLPPQIVWEAIAGAMGAVISAATVSPDIQSTLTSRSHLTEIFGRAVKKRHSALAAANMNTVKPNGQAGFILPN